MLDRVVRRWALPVLLALGTARGAMAGEPSERTLYGRARYRDPQFAAAAFADARAAALAVSAARGDAEGVDRLVAQGASPNATARDGMPLLAWARCADSLPGFRRLLQCGADPDARAGFVPVHAGDVPAWQLVFAAARDPDGSPWLALLLEHGANPNVVQPKSGGDDIVDYSAGTTPLFNAIDSHRVENVELLIKAGADVNHQDNFGNSPLYHAAWNVPPGDFRIVLRLLQAGADWRIRNNDGDEPLCQLMMFDNPHSAGDVRPVIALLERKGADLATAHKKAAAERRRRAELEAARPAGTPHIEEPAKKQ